MAEESDFLLQLAEYEALRQALQEIKEQERYIVIYRVHGILSPLSRLPSQNLLLQNSGAICPPSAMCMGSSFHSVSAFLNNISKRLRRFGQ